jgi:hypothetical protein
MRLASFIGRGGMVDSTTLAVSGLLAPFLAVTVVGSGGMEDSMTLAVS